MQDSEKWKEVTQSFPTWPLKDPLSPTSHLSPPGALPSMLVHALISLTLKHKHGSKQNLNNKNKLQLVLWSVPLLQVHFSVTLKNFSKEFPPHAFFTVSLFIHSSTYSYPAVFCPDYSHGNCSLLKSPTNILLLNQTDIFLIECFSAAFSELTPPLENAILGFYLLIEITFCLTENPILDFCLLTESTFCLTEHNLSVISAGSSISIKLETINPQDLVWASIILPLWSHPFVWIPVSPLPWQFLHLYLQCRLYFELKTPISNLLLLNSSWMFRRYKDPLDGSEWREWKGWLKSQHSEN